MRCVLAISLLASLALLCHGRGEKGDGGHSRGEDRKGHCNRPEHGMALVVKGQDSESCCDSGFHSIDGLCLGCPYGLRFTKCKRDCTIYCDEISNKPFLNCSALANNFFDECEPGCVCPPDKHETVNGRCRELEEICVKKPANPTSKPKTSKGNCSDENMEFSECNTGCISTCRNYLSNETIACAAVCVEGCRCKDGFVLDESTSKCSLPENCTELASPPPNEEWGCCEGNCSDPFPRKCDSCDFGPKCKPGYVRMRDSNDECVKYEECQKICGPNETYDICHEFEENCMNYPTPFSFSAEEPECYSGCQCDEGLVRNHITGMCVSPDDCPAICQKNFEVSGCSKCSKTCQSFNNISGPVQECDSCEQLDVCVCDVGFARDEFGDCILLRDCNSSCNPAENKVLGCSSSLKECPRTGMDTSYTRERLCYPEEDGCVCRPGYLYDRATDQCVTPDECTPPCPVPNTVYMNDSLPISCQDGCYVYPSDLLCYFWDGPDHPVSGCHCAPGYTFNERTEECVEVCPNKCNTSLNQVAMCELCIPTCEDPGAGEYCDVADDCPRGCGCILPYVLNTKTGECVLPSECFPPVCSDCDPVNAVTYKNESCLPLLCYALGRVTYSVKFVGTWNESLYPDYNMPIPHWSPLTGASHKPSYEIWENCFTNVSKGVSNVAERGDPTRIISEFASHREDVLDTIDDGEIILGDSEITRYIDVNKNFHYVTLLSMMGGTMDYMVGVDRLDMCDRRNWKNSIRVCLTLYSTGTKSTIAPGCASHNIQFENCSFGYIELTMVKNRDLQTSCKGVENYTACNGFCQPRCEHGGPRANCPRICKAGCQCPEGYARDDRDECIPLETCAVEPTPNTRCQLGDWMTAAITVLPNSTLVTEVRFVTHRPTGRYSSCPSPNVDVKQCNESEICQSVDGIDEGCAVWIDPCLVEFKCGTVAEASEVGDGVIAKSYASFFEPVRTHVNTTLKFTSLDFLQIDLCVRSSSDEDNYSCDWFLIE